MPTLTNKLNLPQYLVDWLTKDGYDYNNDLNTLSTTGLMKPIRISIITSRHLDQLEMDVSDLVASRMGSAIHDSIERVETVNMSKELRVSKTLNIKGTTFTLTGKYDLLQKNPDGTFTLRDIKTTSVWAYIFGGKDKDYQLQLSIYRWLLTSDEVKLTPEAYIDFFFTDWQSAKAKQAHQEARERGLRPEQVYPQLRLKPGYKIELLSLEETEKFIRDKLTELLENRDLPDDELPRCTDKELWAEDDKWAVYKDSASKRATRVCDSEVDAINYKQSHNLKVIQHRPGKVKRCKYCSAAPFCNQFEELVKANRIAD